MEKLCDKSLTELHDLLVSKEITAIDLTKETLNRIQDTEEQLGSFITISGEKAMALTGAIDLKGITESNPLAGIPIGIKDNIVTRDILATAESKMLHDFDPIYDATVMDKVYQADMIPIGKLNMDEFAMGGSAETSYFKKARNAWDQTKVPGGSSGGSASAVTAGQVPVSLGNDTGGSIRQPAVFNSIVGLKPAYGHVSRFGLVVFASSLDQIGPSTRNVRDNALALNAIGGYDEKDGTSAGVSVPDFTADLIGDTKGMKTALPKEYLGRGVQSDIREAVLKTAGTFKSLRATVEEVNLPHPKYGVAVYYIIAFSETSSNLQRFDDIRYKYHSEDIQNLEDVYVSSRSEGFGTEVRRRIMLRIFSLNAGYYDACLKKAGQVHTLVRRDFESISVDYGLVIGPSTPTVAFSLEENVSDPITMYTNDILTIPVNLAELPDMSISTGFSEDLPVGLQIIGRHFDEHTVYKTAYASEQATDFHTKKPAILGGDD